MVGDGEEQILDLNRVIMQGREEGRERMTILKRLCAIRGVYVPALYDVQYNADGTIASMKPNCPEAPEKVLKAIIPDLDKAFYPTEIPVPYMEIIHDRIMLEIMRGCTRGCRFCQAGIRIARCASGAWSIWWSWRSSWKTRPGMRKSACPACRPAIIPVWRN